MSIASNLKLAETLSKRAEPFIEKLREEGLGDSATTILELIAKLEITGEVEIALSSLYLLLQDSRFDKIEEAKDEASESLTYLYKLMLETYSIFVQAGFPSSAHMVSHLITEVVLSEYTDQESS